MSWLDPHVVFFLLLLFEILIYLSKSQLLVICCYYFLGLNIPFKDSKYYLSTYNEIFLNGASNVFDRNRVYGGLGYKVSDGIKLEIGYMNQIFETSSRDQINLITFINF